jgi:hypothetical protein
MISFIDSSTIDEDRIKEYTKISKGAKSSKSSKSSNSLDICIKVNENPNF